MGNAIVLVMVTAVVSVREVLLLPEWTECRLMFPKMVLECTSQQMTVDHPPKEAVRSFNAGAWLVLAVLLGFPSIPLLEALYTVQ